jgi:hypothetical protein
MRAFYKLQISFTESIETFNAISDILVIKPFDKDLQSGKTPNEWTYEVVQENEDPYFDFIKEFLDILENKYERLSSLGIQKEDISVWYLYEYDQQCNMEFDPTRLKRLGDNGITLCISCWDSGEV